MDRQMDRWLDGCVDQDWMEFVALVSVSVGVGEIPPFLDGIY